MLSFLDPPEIGLLVVLVLVLFGGSQNEFKKGLDAGSKEAAVESDADKLKRLEEIDKAKAAEKTESN
ncbi:MAG: twin-arginine translocase TatA/TatE family subunit [Actinobacteria bacterium]|nr:twin-arginine translocase TatA/TatE family subunit [Actinomycetota bacterium]